jgi:CheY-like chemotaxis protein
MKVLVADDDVTNIFIFKQILSERGHDVLLASSGKHCLTLYQQCMKNCTHPSDSIPINESVLESIRKLDVPLAVLQKPISDKALIDTVEGSYVYKELKKYKFDVDLFKKAGWSHELLKKVIDALENNP